jgi:hypothetical protein
MCQTLLRGSHHDRRPVRRHRPLPGTSPQGRDFVEFWLSLEGDALTRWEEIVFGIRRHYGRLLDEHVEWLPKLIRGAGLA